MSSSYLIKLFIFSTILISFIYTPINANNLLQEKSRIITASAVRVRSNPQTSSQEITKLSVGTIVKEIEKSDRKEKIGQQEDFWYQVVLSDGKQGWVFGAFTKSFETDKQEQIYINLLNDRLTAKTSFNDQVDLVNFLERIAKEVKTPTISAELELGALLALRQSLHSIPFDKDDSGLYKSWLKKQDPKIVYNEPAGSWEVRSDMFWDLQKKYSFLPVGDKIAWEAARNVIPGECEGYFPCYIAAINLSLGEYLSLYPNGKYSQEALQEIQDVVNGFLEDLKNPEQSYRFLDEAESRKDAQGQLNKLQKQISKVPGAKTVTISKQIEQLIQKLN
ncbi:MAG: SH3 domain-containing protein [Acidobacteria bacterium]|nr:SH3 domain-containing protein [Acidobacteriota bacterium]